MEDDPISQLMGEDAVPGGSWVGRCTEAECRTETGVSSGMSWTVFPNTSPNEWGWDASNNRPDIFTTDNTGSITFADWAQPELNDVVAAIVDASGVENQVLGVDGWHSHFGNPDSEGTEKRSPFSNFLYVCLSLSCQIFIVFSITMARQGQKNEAISAPSTRSSSSGEQRTEPTMAGLVWKPGRYSHLVSLAAWMERVGHLHTAHSRAVLR
jgi:hypothetical protein